VELGQASVEIDLALGHSAGQSAFSWLTEQGVSPSAAWAAIDTACREAGVVNATPEPLPETPSVAPDWDTAATMDAVRVERERSAAAPRKGAAVAGTVPAARAAGATTAGQEPEAAPRAEPCASADPGLAAIHGVIDRIRNRFPELHGLDVTGRAAPRIPVRGVQGPEATDEEGREEEERLGDEMLEWTEGAREEGPDSL
jgi:hypothetical protein